MTCENTSTFGHSKAKLSVAFGPTLQFDKKLAPYTSFETGGPAALFLEVTSIEMAAQAIKAACNLGIPYFLLGGGTNLLVSDAGYNGLIIKIDIRGIKQVNEIEIECYAGELLADLVTFASDNSLFGLEFAAGIVGTVGGAIYGNAGAYGGETGPLITELTLISPEGDIKTVSADYVQFDYRHSSLKTTGELLVKARFKLKKGDKEKIYDRVNEIIKIRQSKLPYDERSAGSFFKNIPDSSQEHGKMAAGKLLDEIGAKEMSVGGAAVSSKHANIIINKGNATSKDIRQLADKLKVKVSQRFGIILEEEVEQIGSF